MAQTFIATLTNPTNGKTCKVRATIDSRLIAGMPHILETNRRRAFKKLGADWNDPRCPITASCALRSIDNDGWNQFTIWDNPNADKF